MSPRRGAEYNDRLFQPGLMGQQLYEESSNPPGPEHIPPIMLYLATDQAVGITGQVFGSSRGRMALYSRPKETKGLYKDGVWTLDELVRRFPATLAQDMPKKVG